MGGQRQTVESSGAVALELTDGFELILELGAFAHDLLGRLRVVPQRRVLGFSVQFREAAGGGIDVKDASSAVRRTA